MATLEEKWSSEEDALEGPGRSSFNLDLLQARHIKLLLHYVSSWIDGN